MAGLLERLRFWVPFCSGPRSAVSSIAERSGADWRGAGRASRACDQFTLRSWHGDELARGLEDHYAGPMNAIPRKIVVDEKGTPVEVILPWATFCEVAEVLGLDLDAEAEADLREARRDLEAGTSGAFGPLSSL